MTQLQKTLDAIRGYPEAAKGSAWEASTEAERKAMEDAIVTYLTTGLRADGDAICKLAKTTLARIKRDTPRAVPKKRTPKPTLKPFFPTYPRAPGSR
jgi:hypothetical protein